MDNLPSVTDRCETFRFESGDCLYFDHCGHRVLADWEGSGTIQLIESEVAFLLNGSLVRGDLFPYSFAHFATISTKQEGTFEAVITGNWGRQPASLQSLKNVELDTFSVTDLTTKSSRNWKVQNLSSPVTLDSSFEDGTKHICTVASLLNACSFEVCVPANCQGIQICKTYDQFHGRQCARVWCDDGFKGLWYLPRQNRVQRWGSAWFGFELEPVPQERTIRITMDPPGGTPLWSMSKISVVGLVLQSVKAEY